MKLPLLQSSNYSLTTNIRISKGIPIHPNEMKKYEEKLKKKHQGIQYLGLAMEPYYYLTKTGECTAKFKFTNSTNKDLSLKCIFKSGDAIKTVSFHGDTPVHKRVLMTYRPRVQNESTWNAKCKIQEVAIELRFMFLVLS